MSAQVHEIVAFNYAFESDNKIHSDETAARYGFKGGLVPGVADFAYLSHAVYEVWGDEWLNGGAMEAKFIKPIYHGDTVRAEARETGAEDRLELALLDSQGVVCATGQAQRRAEEAHPNIDDYPHHPLPDIRPDTSPQTFPAGHQLGSLDYVEDSDTSAASAAEMFVAALRGPDGSARWHPALCLSKANEIVKSNVALTSWIHTASRVSYFGAPENGETVSLRGAVVDTYMKRGHVMTECDLAMFANQGRPLAAIHHSAIIRLADA